jgi:hypothetical protein
MLQRGLHCQVVLRLLYIQDLLGGSAVFAAAQHDYSDVALAQVYTNLPVTSQL